MDKNILAIDPGKHFFGYAFFRWGSLLHAGSEKVEKIGSVSLELKDYGAIQLVLERPEVYRQRALKGDPKHLIDLGITLGRVVENFPHCYYEYVLPKVWKGQVPKKIMNDRVYGRLSTNEKKIVDTSRAPKTRRHDMLDAVGIGLWKLRRL